MTDPISALLGQQGRIIDRVGDLERTRPRFRKGVITDDSPLSVDLGDSGTSYTNVKALDSTAYVVNDIVAVLVFGNDLLILGRIGTGPEAWHLIGGGGEPAFQNSWVNYGGSESVAAFMKDPAGFVHLRGHIKSGTSNTIFTLPAGYRPAAHLSVCGKYFDGATPGPCTFRILSSGAVAPDSHHTTVQMCLDGITFRAEQ